METRNLYKVTFIVKGKAISWMRYGTDAVSVMALTMARAREEYGERVLPVGATFIERYVSGN